MSEQVVGTPKIRFKCFDEPWKECLFLEIAETSRGLTYKPSDISKNGVRVLRSSNINEDVFVQYEDDVFVNDTAINIPLTQEGDILITSANGSSRLVGKHTIVSSLTTKTVHGGFMLLARSDNPYFLNASMSSSWYSKFISVYVAGGNGAIGNLNKNDLDTQRIYVPCKDEKHKIGEFFKKLDKNISNQEQKLDKLKTIKKSMLQKMFPKQGSKVPDIRIKGFTGDWETSDFDTIFDRVSSKHHQIQSSDYLKTGRFPVIDQGKQPVIGYYNDPSKVIKNTNMIVFGDHTRELKYIDFDFVVGADGTQLLRTKPTFENIFFYYQLLQKTIPNMGYNRHFKFIAEMLFLHPTLPEQEKIGEFFKQLDKNISNQEQKLYKLKTIKKSMLQKMFV